jgi:tryptophanase
MASAIPEPFRIKVVEPAYLRSPQERERALAEVDYNVFRLKAEDVFIDLPTDNACGAMSDRQWSAMLAADESYVGQSSYFKLSETVARIFGFDRFGCVHQGRAAEHVLFSLLVNTGDCVPGNTIFQTTRWNIEACGGSTVDLLVPDALDAASSHPFKGNLDLDQLARLIERTGANHIPCAIQTITNEGTGGQPVSIDNLRRTTEKLRSHGIPLLFDAARFAENAYFIKEREPGYANRSIQDIVGEIFSHADGFFMSARHDGLVNIGGLLGLRDPELFRRVTVQLNVREGFLSHGGLASRDMEALAVGLQEGMEERYLDYRINQVRNLADQLAAEGVPVLTPVGGHAVYVDAARFFPHLSLEELPAEALVAQLYLRGGVRAARLSGPVARIDESLGAGAAPHSEFVRLSIPRRVYTETHLSYVADILAQIHRDREEVPGMRLVWASDTFRLQTAKYEPVHRTAATKS